MKFATLSHLLNEKSLEYIPKSWFKGNLIVSDEFNIDGTKGRIIALKILPKEIINKPREKIRNQILETAIYANNELGIDIIQLGALTTSVTSGGKWLAENDEYKGYVTHGDSYTAAITCQTTKKTIQLKQLDISKLNLAIIGAYGIIGEAVSKILVPEFKHSTLIGRRKEKLEELKNKINGEYKTTTDLKTNSADVIITATSHPTALLKSDHLKKDAIIIDVSQPPNLNMDVCNERPDIVRVDGGFVDFSDRHNFPLPGIIPGKQFACIAEVIMQAKEEDNNNHVGSIDISYLKKTEELGNKYNFTLKKLSNFGKNIEI